MWIERVKLKNFRIYGGQNEVTFTKSEGKNISLIAGKNGFGKTSFLTSLIWGMYGALMTQVEDKYKKDIRSVGGYDNFVETLINNTQKQEFHSGEKLNTSVQVEIHLMDVLIPSIPCRKVVIKRSFELKSKKERLEILIDGQENELTKQVGYEIFINDFILPREIAKFFFFDAEKIVTLAEARSKAELRTLSKAYSEVLGIKKYEDLKENLNSLLSKLKRSGAQGIDRARLEELETRYNEESKLAERNLKNQTHIEDDNNRLKARIDDIQEQLIREGNEITLDELKSLKKTRDQLKRELEDKRNEFKKFMELIPFLIAKGRFKALVEQIELEFSLKSNELNRNDLKREISKIQQEFSKELKNIVGDAETLKRIKSLFTETSQKRLMQSDSIEGRIILDFDDATARSIISTYNFVTETLPAHFSRIKKEEKDLSQHLNRIMRKIKQGEARKDNPVAQQLRNDKAALQKKIAANEIELRNLAERAGELKIKMASSQKVLSEVEKNYKLAELDQKKFDVTRELLNKLNALTAKIKEEKKYALQKAILFGLKKLMHKQEFIADVNVRIEDDIMDIDLLDAGGNVIDKDSLSKGEQQLYATALLKALVDESGINFPVFIDSPLQKFDRQHSSNVIKQFYPAISEQVVLFPLLEKELSQKEFELLKPNLSSVHLIQNSTEGSFIEQCEISELFTQFKAQDVYAH